ncbi:MAG: helix-turn-helix domain-containing protein [Lentisphaerae bacterium]|nr:helix-turn-helix domain-containing protein [Lentisphaerota bacterium]
MSSIMKELKTEISKLSRREILKAMEPARRIQAAQRSWIADLRRQIAGLQKELAGLRKAMPEGRTAPTAEPADDAGRFWILGKGVRSLRKRLGLTQGELAKLADVTPATVVKWEGTQGKISIRRKETVGKLQAIRGMNKRAAREILGEGAAKKTKAKGKAKAKGAAKPKAKRAPKGKAKAEAKAEA